MIITIHPLHHSNTVTKQHYLYTIKLFVTGSCILIIWILKFPHHSCGLRITKFKCVKKPSSYISRRGHDHWCQACYNNNVPVTYSLLVTANLAHVIQEAVAKACKLLSITGCILHVDRMHSSLQDELSCTELTGCIESSSPVHLEMGIQWSLDSYNTWIDEPLHKRWESS